MKLKNLCATLSLVGISSAAFAGPILIVNGLSQTSEVNTTTAVTNNLAALHAAVGNQVTIADALPTVLAGFSQVWDVRFNTALNAQANSAYSSYLQSGGGLFLMGENGSFMARNNSILSLLNGLGAGGLGFNSCYDGYEKVHSPFNGPNAVTSVNYAASGCFTTKGTGQWITSRADESIGAGVAFGLGSLSGAAAGTVTSILDVNFMMNVYDLPSSQELTKNLIKYVGDEVSRNDVPEPASMLLVGVAALGVLASRRRAVK